MTDPAPRTSPPISRRDALKAVGVGALAFAGVHRLSALVPTPAGAPASDGTPPGLTSVSLPALPYPEDALEPYLDAVTMGLHHSRHHAAYTRNFNGALAELRLAQPVEAILARIPALPAPLRQTVRNHGGGHWNHELFWNIMAPAGAGGGGEPSGTLARAIHDAFGTTAEFRNSFSAAAASVFGSGWVWLIVRPGPSLAIVTTPNQDNPLMKGVVPNEDLGQPILGLDVWEHAYYLRYQNRRADYVENWWNVVHWTEVARRFESAV